MPWLLHFGASAMALAGLPAAATLPPFTVSDARSLGTDELASRLLGPMLASRVIEAKRHEYTGSAVIPEYVEFFTRPENSMPTINGICRTDVIVIEYDWFNRDTISPTTPLAVSRVAARTLYISFPEPTGDPSSESYQRAQERTCAGMTTTAEAFRAPSGGDAQWLAAIYREYSGAGRFRFSCDDFEDRTCRKAREILPGLTLNHAVDVNLIGCPKGKTRDEANNCYTLTFPDSEPSDSPEIPDNTQTYPGGWQLTVVAGMRDGFAPVRIRSLRLEHLSFGVP
jgi:hypothetical protein